MIESITLGRKLKLQMMLTVCLYIDNENGNALIMKIIMMEMRMTMEKAMMTVIMKIKKIKNKKPFIYIEKWREYNKNTCKSPLVFHMLHRLALKVLRDVHCTS